MKVPGGVLVLALAIAGINYPYGEQTPRPDVIEQERTRLLISAVIGTRG